MPGHWLSTSFLPHIEEISVRLILSLWYTAKAAQIELRHQISFLLSLSGSHLFNAYKKGETQQYLIKYPLIHLLLWIKGILYKGQKKKKVQAVGNTHGWESEAKRVLEAIPCKWLSRYSYPLN